MRKTNDQSHWQWHCSKCQQHRRGPICKECGRLAPFADLGAAHVQAYRTWLAIPRDQADAESVQVVNS